MCPPSSMGSTSELTPLTDPSQVGPSGMSADQSAPSAWWRARASRVLGVHLALFALLFCVLCGAWWSMRDRLRSDVAQTLVECADSAAGELRSRVDEQLARQLALAAELQARPHFDPEEAREFARPLAHAREVVELTLWWSEDERALSLREDDSPRLGRTGAERLLKRLRSNGPLVVSPPQRLASGGYGLHCTAAVGGGAEPRGFLTMAVRLDDLFESDLTTREGDVEILLRSETNLSDRPTTLHLIEVDAQHAQAEVEFAGQKMEVVALPTPALLSRASTMGTDVLLGAGLVLLLILAGQSWLRFEREHQLAHSNERFRSLLAHASEAIVVYDVERGTFRHANPAAEELFGRSVTELRNLSPVDISPARQADGSSSAERAAEMIARATAGQMPRFEWVHQDALGQPIPTEISLVRLPTANGIWVRACVHDLRERQEAERALRESEEQYRRIVDTAEEGVWTIDADARTTFVNRRLCELLDRTPEELLGRTPFEFMLPELALDARKRFELRRKGQTESYEHEFIRKDGSPLRVLIHTSPLLSPRGEFEGALAMVTDLTERIALEQQLRQAQKLEVAGQMAGGLAHDFGNLLTGLLGACELLGRHLADDERASRLVSEIQLAGERAGALSRKLLGYAQRGPQPPLPVAVDAFLEDGASIVKGLLPEQCGLELQLGAGERYVELDASELEQVVLNLLLNARDASSGATTIRLQTASETVGAESWVRLSVIDQGSGISEEDMQRIFEPFYTTKDPGRGTGLGLWMVKDLVSRSGGHIQVDSELGRGTALHVVLPEVEAPALEPARPNGQSIQSLPKAPTATRVLLVEDDRGVREIAEEVLALGGYEVESAIDADQGLARMAREPERFDVLLTDLEMPGMSGVELARRCLKLRPDLLAVLMSGYTERGVEAQEAAHVSCFVQKPFTPQGLLQTLRGALEERARHASQGAAKSAANNSQP